MNYEKRLHFFEVSGIVNLINLSRQVKKEEEIING